MYKYPFAIRLAGFDPDERPRLANALAKAPGDGPGYSCLLDDSLQDPDLVIANGDDLKAIASVLAAPPTALDPVIVIGGAVLEFPYPRLLRPLDLGSLYAIMADLLLRRAEAQAQLLARGLPLLTERRRKPRLDLDITDPADYLKRRKAPPTGAVLIIDKSEALRDHLDTLMGAGRMTITWTDSAATALRLCEETAVSLVLINTSTPVIDPYGLTAAIKGQPGGKRTAVVLLVGPGFHYHTARARAAGVRGMLDKPVADQHLVATLKKLLSLPL
ncbi:response regulator [Massilia sp. CF038]|uniref:response regulator n=1 Tax=Massilia sp. CF038 TaxID=1881045 RepID=UPI000910B687|nr:response regulator [Massilia sp. CF038]SHG35386.1 Response regulator receiver domain-containing protein [Massilia sp. CF038]